MDGSSVLKANSSINPWATDVQTTSAASSIIRIAEKNGHLRIVAHEDEVQDIAGTLQKESSSLALIQKLGEISEKKTQLDKMNVEIQCRLMDKETRDITHLDVLEDKIQRLDTLTSHLQQVLEQKRELIQRLQQPLVGDFLQVEASYHPQTRSLFPLIASCLAELSANLENFQWGSDFNLRDGRMAEVLEDIATSLAQLQSGLQTIMQTRRSVTEI